MKLLDYIRGSRKGKEAHSIEREAMQDPFLADALEGYDTVHGDPMGRINAMQKRISGFSKKHYYLRSWGIVAGLLFFVSIGGYFLLRESHSKISREFYSQATVQSDENNVNYSKEGEADQKETEQKAETMIARLQESVECEDSDSSVGNYVREDHFLVKPAGESSLKESAVADALEKKKRGVLQDTEMESVSDEFKRIVTKDSVSGEGGKMVYGVVVDQDKNPLPGAIIRVKGTNLRTLAGYHGEFNIQATERNTLVAQFIGFRKTEIPIDTSNTIEIVMRPDENELTETVVTGYATYKKETDTTGSHAIIVPDLMPEPVIGKREYRRYISENLIRPTDATCKDIRGEVTVSFRVDTAGRPIGITVRKALCPSADAEAIRIVKEGPSWTKGNKEVSVTVKF